MKTTFVRHALLAVAATIAMTAGLHATGPAKAAGPVEVIFVHPEKFTDVSDRYAIPDSNRENFLSRLKEHLEKRAPERLAPGQKLTVTVTDVDLAGDFEPWHGFQYD